MAALNLRRLLNRVLTWDELDSNFEQLNSLLTKDSYTFFGQSASSLYNGINYINKLQSLSSGRIIAFFTNSVDVNDLYIFDGVDWKSLGVKSPYQWNGCATTALSSDRFLFCGGVDSPSFSYKKSYIFDLATLSWTQLENLPYKCYWHSVTTFPNGDIFLTGGDDTTVNFVNSAYIFEFATNKWRKVRSMLTPRAYHQTAILPNGEVILFGGRTAKSPNITTTLESYIYNRELDTWRIAASLPFEMITPNSTQLSSGGVLVAGDRSFGDILRTKIYKYSIESNVWRIVAWVSSSGAVNRGTPQICGMDDNRFYLTWDRDISAFIYCPTSN